MADHFFLGVTNWSPVLDHKKVAITFTVVTRCGPLRGKVSLRNVTNLEQGTPEHDIVIDVSESDTPVGPLRLSVVDNLLIVHCLERTVFVYWVPGCDLLHLTIIF